jgi:hypothetical protein
MRTLNLRKFWLSRRRKRISAQMELWTWTAGGWIASLALRITVAINPRVAGFSLWIASFIAPLGLFT